MREVFFNVVNAFFNSFNISIFTPSGSTNLSLCKNSIRACHKKLKYTKLCRSYFNLFAIFQELTFFNVKFEWTCFYSGWRFICGFFLEAGNRLIQASSHQESSA